MEEKRNANTGNSQQLQIIYYVLRIWLIFYIQYLM